TRSQPATAVLSDDASPRSARTIAIRSTTSAGCCRTMARTCAPSATIRRATTLPTAPAAPVTSTVRPENAPAMDQIYRGCSGEPELADRRGELREIGSRRERARGEEHRRRLDGGDAARAHARG